MTIDRVTIPDREGVGQEGKTLHKSVEPIMMARGELNEGRRGVRKRCRGMS